MLGYAIPTGPLRRLIMSRRPLAATTRLCTSSRAWLSLRFVLQKVTSVDFRQQLRSDWKFSHQDNALS